MAKGLTKEINNAMIKNQKVTQQETKQHNTQLVLKTIYDKPYIARSNSKKVQEDLDDSDQKRTKIAELSQTSRAEIAAITELTRPTVSSIVADLIQQNLVMEVGVGNSDGGKPPILIELNSDSYHLLCLDLGGQVFRGALSNLRGKIVIQKELPPELHNGEASIHIVYQLIEWLMEASDIPILGIGVGVPGLIDPHEGIVHESVNLRWHEFNLRAVLSERYEKPVYVLNDSHAAALAEYTFGNIDNGNSLVVIKTSRGIGAGIVLGGQPFYGDGYGAGEIGHVVVADDGGLCRCGNRGCLETFVNTHAILEQAHILAQSHPESVLAGYRSITWEALITSIQFEDEQTIKLVKHIGRYFGIAISNLMGTLNTKHIVISGRFTQLGPIFLQSIRDVVERRCFPPMARFSEIAFSELGVNGVLLGGAAMVLKHELGVI